MTAMVKTSISILGGIHYSNILTNVFKFLYQMQMLDSKDKCLMSIVHASGHQFVNCRNSVYIIVAKFNKWLLLIIKEHKLYHNSNQITRTVDIFDKESFC